jgi:hypothetical protein
MLVKAEPRQDEKEANRSRMPCFEVDSADQGEAGLALTEKSLLENRPYAFAFVDVRMPPGWDGIKTISKIWQEYARFGGCHLHWICRSLLGGDGQILGVLRSFIRSDQAVCSD